MSTPAINLPPYILHTGAPMPALGLGTWNSPPGEVKLAVIAAIENGYRHIDCAAGYGNEHEVGAALEDVITRGIVKREDVFITSKIWVTNCFPDKVAGAVTKTLADLRLSYVDLYLIHWPLFLKAGTPFPPPDRKDILGYTSESYLGVWRELEKEVTAGRIRHIGCSNMSIKKLLEFYPAATIKPAALQVECHPVLAQNKLKKFCDAHKMAFTAFSPLGSPARPARLIDEGDPTPLAHPAVAAIAAKHGVSPARVLLRWAVQRGTITIPKSVTPARIIENADITSFALTEEDMAAIAALDDPSGKSRTNKGRAFLMDGVAMEAWATNFDLDFEATYSI